MAVDTAEETVVMVRVRTATVVTAVMVTVTDMATAGEVGTADVTAMASPHTWNQTTDGTALRGVEVVDKGEVPVDPEEDGSEMTLTMVSTSQHVAEASEVSSETYHEFEKGPRRPDLHRATLEPRLSHI